MAEKTNIHGSRQFKGIYRPNNSIAKVKLEAEASLIDVRRKEGEDRQQVQTEEELMETSWPGFSFVKVEVQEDTSNDAMFTLEPEVQVEEDDLQLRCNSEDNCITNGFKRSLFQAKFDRIIFGNLGQIASQCISTINQSVSLNHHTLMSKLLGDSGSCASAFSETDSRDLFYTDHSRKNLPKSLVLQKQKTSAISRETPYKCDICSKCFLKKSHLTTHRVVHSGEKPFQCDICNKCFTQKSTLVMHQELHTGEKKLLFKCFTCKKSFSNKSILSKHQIVHTKEKPFKCHTCDRSFARKGSLVSHANTHADVKPYKCDICDKRFTQKGSLIGHKLKHSKEKPFKCEICSKGFTAKGSLVMHQNVHLVEKPYKCNSCNKSFSRKDSLLEHQAVHSVGKPFKCEFCDEYYSQKRNLTRHQARKHSEENSF